MWPRRERAPRNPWMGMRVAAQRLAPRPRLAAYNQGSRTILPYLIRLKNREDD